MVKAAVIVAFGYNSYKKSSKAIPGTLIDLYLSYKHAERIGCKIIVITDNTEKLSNPIVEKSIVEGTISTDIVDFLVNITSKGELHYFKSKESLRGLIENHCRDSTNVFFYYSGHGDSGDLLFPEYTHKNIYYASPSKDVHISINTLLGYISNYLSLNGEIFLLLDMCEANYIQMPFLYTCVNKGSNTWTYKFIGIENYSICQGRHIMCFCNNIEQSLSYKGGSLFTLEVYKNIQKYGTDIVSLANKDVRIYSSHPNLLHIPIWMVNVTKTSIWTLNSDSSITIYLENIVS